MDIWVINQNGFQNRLPAWARECPGHWRRKLAGCNAGHCHNRSPHRSPTRRTSCICESYAAPLRINKSSYELLKKYQSLF